MNLQKLSEFISLILRHKPQVIGITLDEHGWAQVDALLAGINQSGAQHVNRHILDEIVRTDSKQRYSFSTDGKRIRANQGHSIPVDVELEKRVPPAVLFHVLQARYLSMVVSTRTAVFLR